MCDVCRGRHRIYASTKRAKRKLEKAAIATSEQRTRETNPRYSSTKAPPVDGVLPACIGSNGQFRWPNFAPGNFVIRLEFSANVLYSRISYVLFTTINHHLESRHRPLFDRNRSNRIASHHILPTNPHATNSSSELANALTLPPPRQQVLPEQVQMQQEDKPEQQSDQQFMSDNQLSQVSSNQDAALGGLLDASAPSRFCSVKGCKAIIPGSYEFKMCPPCRTRYRAYGNTKRAKWKSEREVFEREMTALRAQEDERRKEKGLGPLADNPEELRAWELSVIDEQIILPSVVNPPPMSSLDPPMAVGSMTFGDHIAAGVYLPPTGSIDTPHSISPYPPLNDPLLAATAAPLPARMCTVSHCHKLLPGYYRYKRCEQHRLQNRHHSQLKRVREKEIKSVGPEEGAQPLDIPPEMNEHEMKAEGSINATLAKLKAKGYQWIKKGRNGRKERKDKGTKKIKPNEQKDEAPAEPETSAIGDGAETKPSDSEERPAVKTPKTQKRSKYSCATTDCHNLLNPGVRWRTCEECRTTERKRKFQVRMELKAAENVYRKGIAETLNTARKAEEEQAAAVASGSGSRGSAAPTDRAESGAVASGSGSAGTPTPSHLGEGASVASGSGSGSVPVPADQPQEASAMDVDADADADGEAESDHEDDEYHVAALLTTEDAAEPSTSMIQAQERPLVWKARKPGTPPVWSTGVSKFRVQLPPTPPPPPTAEELMKLDDPVAFGAFKPTTTPSAIGRILARNPLISVDAFSEILEARGSKPTSECTTPQAEATTTKSVPTPTIPTSAPFVYRAPEKRKTPSDPVAGTWSLVTANQTHPLPTLRFRLYHRRHFRHLMDFRHLIPLILITYHNTPWRLTPIPLSVVQPRRRTGHHY
ncbi:hypothetical protein BDZ97DRAFT_109410 [Flammula alnicola]|nr:hypothetical protein BDZ97DRAFT_109410 [Flammula alnicola]